MEAVRKGFKSWADLGIGIKFREVISRDQAMVRIGFMSGDGSWSYVGRDILDIAADQRTMNFGWNVANDIDTAIHEIGHTLGYEHEHQNPFSGIVWDKEKVYAALAEPPNNWSREKTFFNIIRKLSVNSVQGTQWDPNSVMHYPFEIGLIKNPRFTKHSLAAGRRAFGPRPDLCQTALPSSIPGTGLPRTEANGVACR